MTLEAKELVIGVDGVKLVIMILVAGIIFLYPKFSRVSLRYLTYYFSELRLHSHVPPTNSSKPHISPFLPTVCNGYFTAQCVNTFTLPTTLYPLAFTPSKLRRKSRYLATAYILRSTSLPVSKSYTSDKHVCNKDYKPKFTTAGEELCRCSLQTFRHSIFPLQSIYILK